MSKRLAVYVGILLSLYLISMLMAESRPLFSDFTKFYMSAQLYRQGKSIYAPVPADEVVQWAPQFDESAPLLHPNLNPPFFTLLVLPFAFFELSTALWLWLSLNLLAGLWAMAILEKETRSGSSSTRELGFLILLLAYYPTWISIQYGQVSLFLFLLVILSWKAARRCRDMRAGLWLGFALSLKVFFGLFVLLFLIQRRWRILFVMGGTFLVSWLLGLLVFGLDSLQAYRSVLGDITWFATNWNASFLGFFTRILGGAESTPVIDRPELARLGSVLCSVLAAGAMVQVARRASRAERAVSFDLAFSATTVLMLLLSPLGWLYYFPILMLPAVIVWQTSASTPRVTTYRRILVAAGVLSTLPIPLVSFSEVDTPWHWYFWSAVSFFALILLSALLFLLSQRAYEIEQESELR